MVSNQENVSNTPLLVRLAPLFTGLLAAIAVLVNAALRGFPVPIDVVGVFLVIGVAATWIARRTPLTGSLFIAVLAGVVVVIVYGG